jgi:hypothetical protein
VEKKSFSPEFLESDDEDVTRAAEDQREEGGHGRVQKHRDGAISELLTLNVIKELKLYVNI